MPRNGDVIMSSLEMRNLIFEALSVEDIADTPWNMTFKMYGYKGCISALRAIVEHLAVEHGLIDKIVEIPKSAWGVPGATPSYGHNTNFSEDELDLFTEEVHLLMFQNVLSPGATGSYGDSWPYFHVTKYGLICLENRDILPYDPERYLNRLRDIASVDEWEMFYVAQGLRCFNAGALEASIIMLGLAGEYLAIRLIDKMTDFLKENERDKYFEFISMLNGKTKISQRYSEYEEMLRDVLKIKDDTGNIKYQRLKSYTPLLDGPAKAIYATYLRLTRNELAHPSVIKIDRIPCITMFISFIKYCEAQHKYLDFYNENS